MKFYAISFLLGKITKNCGGDEKSEVTFQVAFEAARREEKVINDCMKFLLFPEEGCE